MRQFQFDPSRGWKQNEEFLPPPAYTHQSLPFNWGWHQNPHISTNINEATGEAVLTNKSKTRRFRVQYVTPDTKSVPSVSPFRLPEDPAILEVISKLAEVLNERPVWTRRAIGNRIGHEPLPVPISKALHHVAYQFKGGPFRDAIIKYGVDPRTNKQYRNYQTVLFKLYEADEKGTFKPWTDVRKGIPLNKNVVRRDTSSHIFDGKTLALDGKIWQLCDITDPLLCHLIRNATLRKEYEATTDGYFSNGAWAKIHAIMRTKLIAIRAHIEISDSDFKDAMNLPDVIEDNNKESYKITVPVPDIRKVEIDSQITGSGGDANFMGKNAIRRRNRRVLNVKMSQKLGIEKGTGTVMVKKKSKYLSEKPLQRPKSCEADDAEVMLNEGRERQKGEGMVPSQGPTVGARATLHQEGQPNSPSDVYQTAKENIEVAADDLEDDDNDEGESEDDDSEEDDLEDSESQDEDDLGDEGGEIGSEQDEEDYDGETTDIVHPTT
jgi:general transcription factor 3C polypeptide 5 (transcription factor C subunit 1)